MVKYIIVFEKPFEDISSIGPFNSWPEAITYGEDNILGETTWHLSELEEPANG